MERKILPQIDFVATPPSAPPLWKMMFLGFLNSIQLYFWVNALFTLCESYLHSFNYAFFWTKSIFDASQETIKKSAYSSSLLTLFVKRKGGENSEI